MAEQRHVKESGRCRPHVPPGLSLCRHTTVARKAVRQTAPRPFRSRQTAAAFSGGGRERNRPQPVRSRASGPASLRAFSPPVPSAPADVRQPVQGGERSANLKTLQPRAEPVVRQGGGAERLPRRGNSKARVGELPRCPRCERTGESSGEL